ncbi:hypothetical protein COU87_04455 [Candidatus Roizmanbacteria bacterium CG10_big_fil_rev_8_21_14_0_10_39_12]|uniref:Large ribosomal subunit protein uL1 n=1 Tax=Candidatus Roizmanbacteria bacterium CG10_big_fil_rev_8_21_14_0_10_39_12 TaxID=1974852 RepID=A0A2M8KNF9_9BACT|nr:MAG: hypothetical protein COU87_04455 [Candidatus Roizmanbacteria bacterium CG10_big_fil_rev_8_21_14_0_10_39_12]
MGKIRTRLIGDEDVEEKQKKQSKERAARKKEQEKKNESHEDVVVAKEAGSIDEPEGEEKVEKKAKKSAKKTAREPKKIGAKHLASKAKVDATKAYPLVEAISLLKKLSYASFDESVELHMSTTEIGLRGEVTLPHGTGRTVRVAIVDDAVLAQIEKGEIEFDVLVSHPSNMAKLAKFAKVLGPKGLMPNPKSGTIGLEPEKLAGKFLKGSLRWKTEPKFPLIHQMIGKASLKPEQIHENAKSFIEAVGVKNILKVHIKTTMSPGLQVDLLSI